MNIFSKDGPQFRVVAVDQYYSVAAVFVDGIYSLEGAFILYWLFGFNNHPMNIARQLLAANSQRKLVAEELRLEETEVVVRHKLTMQMIHVTSSLELCKDHVIAECFVIGFWILSEEVEE